MKKGILFLLLVCTITAKAQTLKDALYGGKLKTDSGSVIRKGDDLSSKNDTNRKKQADPVINKLPGAAMDSSVKKTTAPTDTAAIVDVNKMDNKSALKDNNKIWKEFMDSIVITLKEEVLTSKKIKSGTYFVMVEYEIGLDGQVNINNIFPSPENKFLEQQVKERLTLNAPRLNPVLAGNGKPRKVIKRYNFNITKM